MKRLAILLYGVLVYAIFFPTFCYLFAFVGGFLVPKTVDSGGPESPLWLAVTINVGLIALFGVQHAIMTRPWFKEWWTQFIPPAAERSTFVLIASGILILLFWQWRPIPIEIWSIANPVAQGVIYGVFALGAVIVLLSSFLIDHFDLFGLRQVWLQWKNREYTHHPFVVRSLYRVVRHPLMVGFIIAFWATPTMTLGHLLFAGVFTAYILYGITLEERDLVRHLGDDYRRYRDTTPALVPFTKPKALAETVSAYETTASTTENRGMPRAGRKAGPGFLMASGRPSPCVVHACQTPAPLGSSATHPGNLTPSMWQRSHRECRRRRRGWCRFLPLRLCYHRSSPASETDGPPKQGTSFPSQETPQ